MGNKNSTIDDVMEAIGEYSNKVEEKFNKVDESFKKIQATMVTRDILDEKLTDLKADLTIIMRKEDRKLEALVDLLKTKRVISEAEGLQILSMEPFPKS